MKSTSFQPKQKMRLRTFDGGGRLGVGSRYRCRENHSALQLQLQTPTHHPPISKNNVARLATCVTRRLAENSIAQSAPFRERILRVEFESFLFGIRFDLASEDLLMRHQKVLGSASLGDGTVSPLGIPVDASPGLYR